MVQNVYDTPEFFERYSQLPRSVYGLEGAPEWLAIQALLPDLTGKQVVDLGCGFGWFARWARTQGAASVLGLDLSEKMLARASAETDDPAIEYQIADLETLELPERAFDFAYSSLALHYIEDFARLVRTVFQALRTGSQFVFTIEHPIYMAPTRPSWLTDEDGRRVWSVDHYSVEGRRTTDWLIAGVVKHHRMTATTLNTLIEVGFSIRRLIEWYPTTEQVAANPALADELDRPMMLVVSAQR